MITIELVYDEITDALARAYAAFSGPQTSTLMRDIGKYLAKSTSERIGRGGPAPDGTPQAPKAESTMRRYGRIGGADDRPLNHYGFLRNSPHFSFGADYAEVGVTNVYAAVKQFGAKKGSSGPYSGINKKGHPFPVLPLGAISPPGPSSA